MEHDFDTRNRDGTIEKVSKRKFRFGLLVWPTLVVTVFVFIVSVAPLDQTQSSSSNIHLVLNKIVKIFAGKNKNNREIALSARSHMVPIEAAINAYFLNTGQYPASLKDLLYDPGLPGWAGPYLKASQILDGWNKPYTYDPNGKTNNRGYFIISYGADGKPGGEGYGADIYND